MTTSRWLFLVLALALVAGPAMAAWEDDLASQMQWDYECDVTFFSNVIEREIEGETVIMAKVHCEDGRVFDAIQRHAFEDFEVSECTLSEEAC